MKLTVTRELDGCPSLIVALGSATAIRILEFMPSWVDRNATVEFDPQDATMLGCYVDQHLSASAPCADAVSVALKGGDLNGDGQVGFDDFSLAADCMAAVQRNWGKE